MVQLDSDGTVAEREVTAALRTELIVVTKK